MILQYKESSHFTLVNIYGITSEIPDFHRNIIEKNRGVASESYILCWNFNLVLGSETGSFNYKNVGSKKSSLKLLENIDSKNVYYHLREKVFNEQTYTLRHTKHLQQARPDFSYTSFTVKY